MSQGPLDEVEHVVQALVPDEAARILLAMAPGEPVLHVRRRTWSGGSVVSSARLSHPGSRDSLFGPHRREICMHYELYYWPTIQGRGEYVRLALEEAGAPYRDVARESGRHGGVPALMRYLDGRRIDRPPFAPPFLKSGKLLIGQTANILQYLGPRHGLAPAGEAARLWTHQLQLTIADFVTEIHDTHHPISSGSYYEEQKKEARRRAADFRESRAPKYLGYFESLLARHSRRAGYLHGARLTYADLSLFQLVAGLSYAFPKAMTKAARRYPRLFALHERVQARPRIAAYLASPRRIPFNNEGIFRHYPELDPPSSMRAL